MYITYYYGYTVPPWLVDTTGSEGVCVSRSVDNSNNNNNNNTASARVVFGHNIVAWMFSVLIAGVPCRWELWYVSGVARVCGNTNSLVFGPGVMMILLCS